MKTRGLGWGAVLVVGVVMGGWLSKARVAAGGGGLLPLSTATLQISTTPEQPFKVAIARQTNGDARTFDGAAPMQLEVGDWFVDVIPASQSFQRRRLKVHLTSGQVLMLPVELRTVSPPPASPPPAAEPAPQVEPPAIVPVEPPSAPQVVSPMAPEPNEMKKLFGAKYVAPNVDDMRPTVMGGEVPLEQLERYMQARKAALQSCYEREQRKRRNLAGTVFVQFTITPLGRTSGIKANGMNAAVEGCIKTVLRGWVLPFKPPSEVGVVFSVYFDPAQVKPKPSEHLVY